MQIVLPGVFFTKCLKSVIPAQAGLHGRRTRPVWHSCLAKALGRPPRTVWLLGSHSARPMPNAVECRIVSRARYDRPVERSAAKQRTIAQASGEDPPSSSPSRRRARRAHVRHLAAHAFCTAGSGLFPPLPLPFPMTVCRAAVAASAPSTHAHASGTRWPQPRRICALSGRLLARASEYALPSQRRSQPRDPRF